ncbi:hypothetical protein BDE02_08G158200 [Populus trichocarpa]|nr:hypothetical protein BDE02_08G158200 [Populus trichocarpa]
MPFSFSAQITRWLNGLGINPKNFTSTTFLLGCPNKWKIRRGRIKVRLHDLTKNKNLTPCTVGLAQKTNHA